MGILDSLKKAATDTLKTVAEDAIKSATAASAASAKVASLVGSKATDSTSAPPAASPASAKAAALVGSKVAPNEQSYPASKELSYAEVEAIIDARVKARNMRSNWRYSIVDLMGILDMNSSLDSRKALAARLNYSGRDADGSAEKNMWLHAELLKILAKNGGEVPSNLKSASDRSYTTTAASDLAADRALAAARSTVGSKELSRAEVDAIIDARVRAKGGSLNWRGSITDLMTALDMNNSLASRAAIAARLNYSGYDADGSTEKNMWLREELLNALARNGGEVPSYLL